MEGDIIGSCLCAWIRVIRLPFSGVCTGITLTITPRRHTQSQSANAVETHLAYLALHLFHILYMQALIFAFFRESVQVRASATMKFPFLPHCTSSN